MPVWHLFAVSKTLNAQDATHRAEWGAEAEAVWGLTGNSTPAAGTVYLKDLKLNSPNAGSLRRINDSRRC